jgi:hypothetical protein
MSGERNLLSRWLTVTGWLCAFGVALVIIDAALLLPRLPETWWQPEQVTQVTSGNALLDLRLMTHMSLWGWAGSWGYLGALVWLPLAVVRIVKGRRHGQSMTRPDRALCTSVLVLVVACVGLVHFTPLRYVSFCHFVL